MRTNTAEIKRQIEREFDAIKDSVSSMAWHGFLNREMFLQNASELREHVDKITELYKQL